MTSRLSKRQLTGGVCRAQKRVRKDVDDIAALRQREFRLNPRAEATIQLLVQSVMANAEVSHQRLSELNSFLKELKPGSLDERSFHSIHNALLLTLGYNSRLQLESTLENGCNALQILTAALLCLRELYEYRRRDHASTYIPCNGNTLNESTNLVVGIAFQVSSVIRRNTPASDHVEQLSAVLQACSEVLQALVFTPGIFPRVMHQQPSAREEMLLALFASNRYSSDHKIESLLSTLESSIDLKVRHPTDCLALGRIAVKTRNGFSLPKGFAENFVGEDRIFLWLCIYCLSNSSVSGISEGVADLAVRDLVDRITQDDQGSSCVSLLAVEALDVFLQLASRDCCNRVLQRLLRIHQDTNDHNIKQCLLVQVTESCMSRLDALEIIQNGHSLGCMLDIATDTANELLSKRAAGVAIKILRQGLLRGRPPTLSVENISKLLASRTVSLVETGLTFLDQLLEICCIESRNRANNTTNIPICSYAAARALASVAASKDGVLSTTAKEGLVRCFVRFVHEAKDLSSFARTPTIVRFLARVVGGAFDSTSNRDDRGVAALIVLQMSRNPSNRRILAQTPGLVSSMIRYIREWPEDDHLSTVAAISRDSMKKHIFVLAEAL